MKQLAFISLIVIAAIIQGCGGGGDGGTKSKDGMKLVSNDIKPDGKIDKELTPYEGANESPHLAWSQIPTGTKRYVFIMDDISVDPAYVHWNFYTDNKNITKLERDSSDTQKMPADVIEMLNSDGNANYIGPFPPSGETHTYQFCIYALDTTPNDIDVTSSFTNKSFKAKYKNTIIDSDCFKAYYKRP